MRIARHVWRILTLAMALSGVAASLAAQDSTAAHARPDSVAPPVKDSMAFTRAHTDSMPHDSISAVRADSERPGISSDTSLSFLHKAPVGPGGALWRSLLLPGWGQAKLGQGVAAGLFIAVEGLSLGMALKANSELKYLQPIDSAAAASKSQEREDWLVIMAVNHLIAGLQAYVSAHLWDFPGDLALRPAPHGGVAATLTFPVHVP